MNYLEESFSRTRYNRDGCCIEHGGVLVVPDGYRFPQVCLVTGEPVSTPPERHTFTFLPAGGLGVIGFVARLFFAKRLQCYYCLSDRIVWRRRMLFLCALVLFACAVPISFALPGSYGVISMPAFFGGGLTLVFFRKPAVSATAGVLRIRGVHPSVLNIVYKANNFPQPAPATGRG